MDNNKLFHAIDDRDQPNIEDESVDRFANEGSPGSAVLTTYLKHIGFSKDKKRRRCISSELERGTPA